MTFIIRPLEKCIRFAKNWPRPPCYRSLNRNSKVRELAGFRPWIFNRDNDRQQLGKIIGRFDRLSAFFYDLRPLLNES